ncbi:MAG TPA: hypothetical protein VEG38_15970 [Acidimicrobiia bacterium]|nr:hypothetical protein [Acidimicrobiia bacterium]
MSVQHWDAPLDEESVQAVLLSREAYRRTEFIVLRGDGDTTALVRIACSSQDALFNPVIAVEWLGGPDDCAYVVRPDVDTANATALAEVAEAVGNTAPIYVVEGRYQHVNFIVRPRPIEVRLIDVVPPEPPRLFDLARQAITIDEDLPPIRLVADLIDIRALAATERPDTHFLLPCQGAGLDLPGTVDYLDQRPARADWTLVGCERSRQFHRWFYGEEPDRRVELCPDRLVTAVVHAAPATLLRCCLIERGIRVDGNRAVVPWGTNLGEVQAALRALTLPEAGPE